MNELKILLSPVEVEEIKRELEKLFAFQDKSLTGNKLSALMDAIEDYGFPFRAIVAGIRSLFEVDLKAIKLINIKDAIRGFIQYDTSAKGCDACGQTGVKIMWEGNRQYMFACRCEKGKEYIAVAPIWNSFAIQRIGGETYLTERVPIEVIDE